MTLQELLKYFDLGPNVTYRSGKPKPNSYREAIE